MTAQHSILQHHASEPRLRWMICVSLIVHLCAGIVLLGTPPDARRSVYYSPVYSVSLVDAPPGPSQTGPASAPSPAVSLWKGPRVVGSQLKAPAKRKHPTLTIAKKDRSSRLPDTPAGGREAGAGRQQRTRKDTGAASGSGGAQSGTPPGDARQAGALNPRLAGYYQAVWSRVKGAWVLPRREALGRGLEAVVIITISRSGKVLNTYFEKRSGDTYLDRSVIRAIKKAGPLPPLPADFRDDVLELGIRFLPDDDKSGG